MDVDGDGASDAPWDFGTSSEYPVIDYRSGASACANGSAVSNAVNNPGLVSDCDTLLAARDALAGTATLNWAADTPITDWDGIGDDSLAGSPARVTRLYLNGMGLDGNIPAQLGDLPALKRLFLHSNDLIGSIPAELGKLTGLTHLWLNSNYLSGQIPESLGGLTMLSRLRLAGNGFTGCLPAELAAVNNSDADQLGLETCS